MSTIKGGSVGTITRLKKSIKSGGRKDTIANIPEEGVTIRFLTEPTEWFEYFEHYDDSRTGSYYFPCSEGCGFCDDNPGARASKRYLVSAVDTEENKAIALKLPLSVASTLMKKYDRYKTILDRDYYLSKEGSGMDTEYDVTPEPPAKFNVGKYDLIDAEAILSSMLDQADDVEDDDEDEDERPARKSRGTSSKKRASSKTAVKKRRPVEVDEDDEDDDEDEEVSRPVRRVKKRRK